MKLFTAIFALLFLPTCWRKPRYGMLLLVALAAVFLGGSLEVTSGKFIYAAFFGLLMLAWLPGLLCTRGAWIRHPVARWLLAVFAVILISRLAGAAHGIPLVDWFRELSPLLGYSWILLGLCAFAPPVDMRKYARILLTFIAILTVPITLQWMYFRSLVPESLDLLGNPTLGPGVTLFGAFLATAFVLEAKDKRTKRKFALLVLGFVAAAFLTGTRVAIASLAAGFLAYFWLLRRERKVSFGAAISAGVRTAAVLLLAVITLAAAKVIDVSAMLDRYTEAATSQILENNTVTDRVLESLDGWNAFLQRPIVGQGLGYRIDTVYTTGGVEYEPDAFFMHNFYVYLLAKLGVTGFVVFLGFLISILRHAIQGYFRRADGFEKYYFGSMAALMIGLLLMSATSAQFTERLPDALLGIMTGMMIAIDSRGTKLRPGAGLAVSN